MKNLSHWPPGLPLHVQLPQTSLYYNLEVSTTSYPDRNAIVYYDNTISYAELKRQVDALAGFLQQQFCVVKGDRVALYLQNSPQFIIAFYAILRIGAVVVPVNTMNLMEDVRHIVTDSGSKVAIFGQELAANITPLLGNELDHLLAACYSDYLIANTDLPIPDVVTAPRVDMTSTGMVSWHQAMQGKAIATDMAIGPDDLAVIPYTSGTTGAPKGCMHTHRSVMHTAVAPAEFCRMAKDQTALAALPMFHVTGLQNGVNAVVYVGGTAVVMTRWDRRCAALLIQRYRITSWVAIPTMLIDFMAQPELDQFDLSSMKVLSGGGAAMPKAVAEKDSVIVGACHTWKAMACRKPWRPRTIIRPIAPSRSVLAFRFRILMRSWSTQTHYKYWQITKSAKFCCMDRRYSKATGDNPMPPNRRLSRSKVYVISARATWPMSMTKVISFWLIASNA